MGDQAATALAAAKPAVFWSDREDAPPPNPALDGDVEADLTVIGGGLTGLWAAIQALEESPGMKVVLVESERCGFGASSRNGGFCVSSLTHGLNNGLFHWPGEIETLVRLGRENLDAIEAGIERYQIEAGFERVGEVEVATADWHLSELRDSFEAHQAVGYDVELFDADQMQARVHSPTYRGGLILNRDVALVDPARLCWGLRAAAEGLGALIFEQTAARSVSSDPPGLSVSTSGGTIRSDRVLMATNAYPGPVRRPRRYVIPVYEQVLMTEPLSTRQLNSVGWEGREGIGDASNQIHYYRLTGDNRILWGGFDAIYHFNNGVHSRHDQSDYVHGGLAGTFFTTFPQLEDVKFTHRWGGPIGTTTRFSAAWGTSHRGRLAWVAGYTGLGVGASRFGARVALDLVLGKKTEQTELEMVRKKPFPFPPEPLRWAGVSITKNAMQRADRRHGKRGPWLRTLDRIGVGFDS